MTGDAPAELDTAMTKRCGIRCFVEQRGCNKWLSTLDRAAPVTRINVRARTFSTNKAICRVTSGLSEPDKRGQDRPHGKAQCPTTFQGYLLDQALKTAHCSYSSRRSRKILIRHPAQQVSSEWLAALTALSTLKINMGEWSRSNMQMGNGAVRHPVECQLCVRRDPISVPAELSRIRPGKFSSPGKRRQGLE